MKMDNYKIKDRTVIKSFEAQDLKIYAYTLPDIPNHKGCIKVGETSRSVEERVTEQTRILGLKPNILFNKKAKKNTGAWFHDKDLHKYFILNNIEKKDFGTGADEWFYFNGTPEKCEELTNKFIANDYSDVEINDSKINYVLRAEQQEAINKTLKYYKKPISGNEYLWNAKPRFGKTLTTYDFIRKIKAKNILIVTNRPAIANSWWDDFKTFIAWQEPNIKFISDTEHLKGKVMTRAEYISFISSKDDEELNHIGCITFISLQDLKGAKVFGGNYNKLKWVADINWELLIIDEAHEGVDTFKTDSILKKIKTNFILHLSGTPFKAIATSKFKKEQIYNWSYLDEQKAKLNWGSDKDTNPYENLPTLNLFTYQMSKMIRNKTSYKSEFLDENNADYTFDLNEFFRTKENGVFIYEESVIKFLDNLTAKNFPFAESKYRHMLNHTFWLLPGVSSCKAMEKILRKHCFFKDYTIVLAAGDGKSILDNINIEEIASDIKENEKSFNKVKKAIAENDKTITLSCGQLTTGVTIKEWTAVFMLSNIKSPSLYFQAAFRGQNPYEFRDKETGKLYRKENAYIFDFAPERTLTLFDDLANNLFINGANSTSNKKEENIKELLKFFPIIGEDENGEMYELDERDVLTLPNKIKSKEVVKQGFMSNLLFENISGIFRAPAMIKEILDKISPEKKKRITIKRDININSLSINENGDIDIPKNIIISKAKDIFGEDTHSKEILSFYKIDKQNKDKISNYIWGEYQSRFDNLKNEFDITKNEFEKIKNKAKSNINEKISNSLDINIDVLGEFEKKYNLDIKNFETEEERKQKKLEFEKLEKEIKIKTSKEINKIVQEVIEDVVETQIIKQEEKRKKETEEDVRAHLRGFSRTIPAFIMAYGDRETTLSNFDKKVDEETFRELTSITINEFRMLRDGITVKDEETGEERFLNGLFNENIFNAAIQEFLDLKEQLGNYIENNSGEDIFDYIPPQKTNQIFTPRKVVKLMINMLEEENSNIFKDKNLKFIDLYSKSGLYIVEIIKKLNEGLKDVITDNKERIKHIMENQVYACAPSNIIYNMVKNYIYSNFDYVNTKNLMELDVSSFTEKSSLEKILNEKRGVNLKFDIVIGNPPYQEADKNTIQGSARPIYQHFITEGKKLNPKYMSFIIPSVWFNGGKGLDDFRNEILNDIRMKLIYNYITPQDIFPNVNLRGGVNYFLWSKDYDNSKDGIKVENIKNNKTIDVDIRPFKISGLDIFISDNKAMKILKKLIESEEILLEENTNKMLIDYVSTRNAFGFETKFRNNELFTSEPIQNNPVGIYASKGLFGYIDDSTIKKNRQWILRWKVLTPFANNIGTNLLDDNLNTIISKPNTIATETYLVIGAELNLNEISANNLAKYLKCKFVRFLISLAKANQNGTAKTYKFVPLQDFTEKSDINWEKGIDEIDNELFEKYNLSEEERVHIRTSIKEMHLSKENQIYELSH